MPPITAGRVNPVFPTSIAGPSERLNSSPSLIISTPSIKRFPSREARLVNPQVYRESLQRFLQDRRFQTLVFECYWMEGPPTSTPSQPREFSLTWLSVSTVTAVKRSQTGSRPVSRSHTCTFSESRLRFHLLITTESSREHSRPWAAGERNATDKEC